MAAQLTFEGQVDQIAKLIGTVAADLRLALYTANAGGTKATILANLTEATFTGYAETTPVFAVVGNDANNRQVWTAPVQTFTAGAIGGPQTILGYYLFNTATGKLYFFEAFGAPILINTAGQFIDVTPSWYYGDLTPPL